MADHKRHKKNSPVQAVFKDLKVPPLAEGQILACDARVFALDFLLKL